MPKFHLDKVGTRLNFYQNQLRASIYIYLVINDNVLSKNVTVSLIDNTTPRVARSNFIITANRLS